MKFDCGETGRERESRLSVWHRWFAWHFVRIGSHDCRWLEWVERKGVHFSNQGGDYWSWEYRLPVKGRKGPPLSPGPARPGQGWYDDFV